MDTHIPVFLPSPSPAPTPQRAPSPALSSSAPSRNPIPIPSSEIDSTFSTTTNLTTSVLNARILSFSDEFFASASNLLTPTPPIHRPGHYVHTGAWYDGWETRRHNPNEYDWVVIKLGCVARVKGVEIDTGFFRGNQAELAAVEGSFLPPTSTEGGGQEDEKVKSESFDGWKWILKPVECGPGCRQAWTVPVGGEDGGLDAVTHIRLRMYPDGGIARLRLYGHAIPPPTPPPSSADSGESNILEEELSAALNGGVALSSSDQHFGARSNLLLPGRGVDMGDGWETKRSREKGHTDWVIVKLGLPAERISRVVVDTKDFRGNFPQRVRVEGLVDWGEGEGEDETQRQRQPGPVEEGWRELVRGERKCAADVEHVFKGEEELVGMVTEGEGKGKAWTHVKMTIIPDGGVKRLRVFGERA